MSDLKVNIINHPLIQHKLTLMRRKETGSKDFRQLLDEISMLMAYEVTRDFPTKDIEIETPIAKCNAKVLAGKKVAIVPILRAGLGMVNGIINLIPAAKIGHIGMYRDEKTLEPVEYFYKMPKDISERLLLVVDPMLATGGSAVAAVDMLKKRGAKSLIFMCLISAPEGIKLFNEKHPDVPIYSACVDDHLNEHGYIVPGIGDAGDRIFGTI
ncbi:uracil phosphoribosyltransferase [Megamonas hypermegale]|uniref:uracil phosphoribosyltransferase n=1 Tax=Megamonas hypermegale TaxID=158847 RepID=UPI00242FE5EF|nr:uracil phosphoribosyltransferase [Megamonas hypermegale]